VFLKDKLLDILALQGALGNGNRLLALLVDILEAELFSADLEDLDVARGGRHAKQLRLVAVLLVHVDDGNVEPLAVEGGADVEFWDVDGALDPLWVGLARINAGADVDGDRLAVHVLGEEQERPVRGLARDARGARHERADDVDALGNGGHAQVLGLADEDVEPDGHGQRVRQVVQLLGALVAGGPDRVPDVPLVEADFGPVLVLGRRGDAVKVGELGQVQLAPREVDQGRRDLNGALGGVRSRDVGVVLGVAVVEMDRVHVNVSRAFLENVAVPIRDTVTSAQNQLNRRIKQFQCCVLSKVWSC
jgi:hypothetical protein